LRARKPCSRATSAAHDESAHDLVADFGLGDEYGAQTLRRDQQRFDSADRLCIDKRRTAGKIANLGEKVARRFLVMTTLVRP
jgi:hypothetical protein